MLMKKLFTALSVLLCVSLHTQAQDTIRMNTKDPVLVSAKNKVYIIVPADTLGADSVVVVNSKAYFKLIQDKQSCKTFINLYQVYQERVSTGDKQVQSLIDSYEVIIKTRDSSYTTLLQEYYSLNSLLSSSITQTESAILISRSSLDTLSRSLQTISEDNKLLRKDLTIMKQQNNKNKWRFGLAGLGIGLLVGILIMH